MKTLPRFAATLVVVASTMLPMQSAEAFFGWFAPWNWFDGPGWGNYYYPYYGHGYPYWGGYYPYYGYGYGYPYYGYTYAYPYAYTYPATAPASATSDSGK